MQFRNRGFLAGCKVLSKDQVQRLRELCGQHLLYYSAGFAPKNIGDSGSNPVWKLELLCARDPAFFPLATNTYVAASAAALIGTEELRVWRDQVQIKPAFIGAETIDPCII